MSITVNLPQSASVEDIKKQFLPAVVREVKGLTVYRDQSLDEQIMGACSLKRDECG